MTTAQPAGADTGTISKIDKAREITAQALDELSSQLEAGSSASLTAYLAAMSRFHSYSFGNILLILSQNPEATRVAGFHTWKKLGRSVKRGEKGIAIFAPMRLKANRGETSSRDKKPGRKSSDEDETYLRFRVVYVFDVSQTEGEPLPEPSRVGGDPGVALIQLEASVRAAGITLADSDELGSADGASRGGAILLKSNLAPAERFSVLAHEWAHEMLHQRDTENRPSKTVRETEAEAVAFVVCQSVGMHTGSAAADYIRLYRGDAETLADSLDRIQKTACTIIESLASSEQPARAQVSPEVAPAASDRKQR